MQTIEETIACLEYLQSQKGLGVPNETFEVAINALKTIERQETLITQYAMSNETKKYLENKCEIDEVVRYHTIEQLDAYFAEHYDEFITTHERESKNDQMTIYTSFVNIIRKKEEDK